MNTETTIAAANETSQPTYPHSATYSPDDNKLRIYPAHRLDADEYASVKAAGFAWAPRQELFVAPMWTPEREALAAELCGEIGDEDTSLTDRAEDRAGRFEGYSGRRADEAASARDGVARIADGIPFGQPILVGHHSERHARKDAEKIENGMRRAVKLWETASYWERRAAGALRAAKYKELPAVRARRIKGIEADQRKTQKTSNEAAQAVKVWGTLHEDGRMPKKTGEPSTFLERAVFVSGNTNLQPFGIYSDLAGGKITPEEAQARALESARATMDRCGAWLTHYSNRLAYERAMLAEGGGLAADRFDLQPGGQVCIRGRWEVIVRINRKDGAAVSVSVAGRGWTSGVEEITDYRPASDAAAAAVKALTTKAPLVNYPAAGCVEMTQAQWTAIHTDSKRTDTIKGTDTHAAHRVRYVMNHIARHHGGTTARDQWGMTAVFITDAKRTDAPELNPAPKAPRRSMARKIADAAGVDTSATPDEPTDPAPTLEAAKAEARAVLADLTAPTTADVQAETARLQARNAAAAERKADGAEFDAMREALRTGQAVQVVSAPQLFPTPADIAARMVALADVQPGECVLEPSAGTGAIARAVLDAVDTEVMAYEINPKLCAGLASAFPSFKLQSRCRDFLEVTDFQGGYPVVLMNPPFADGADVKHIKHARTFLAPGGRLVAICAAGPLQHAELQPLAASWEYLPAGTFAHTNVRAVLLTIRG